MGKIMPLLKFVLGVLLVPVALFVFWGAGQAVWALVKAYKITLYFLLGAGAYLMLHKYIFKFSRLYVLAHEAVHAAAALLSGHRVKSITVGEDSGNVKLSGVNTFVLLAPYIFPLFAFCSVFAYFLFNLWVPSVDKRVFMFLFGFFAAHHLAHTYTALTEVNQSDIKLAGGKIFSFPVIVVANAAVLVLMAELFFPGVIPVWDIARGVVRNTVIFWQTFWIYFKQLLTWAANL